jgi:regulation of enolase protein 1 (concanavalin A-like superfamily)
LGEQGQEWRLTALSRLGIVRLSAGMVAEAESEATGAGQVSLRLERSDDLVRAFCSADGKTWFTVGQIAFPVDDPIQVGLHAIGCIDINVYLYSPSPEGAAIRFESFHLWQT